MIHTVHLYQMTTRIQQSQAPSQVRKKRSQVRKKRNQALNQVTEPNKAETTPSTEVKYRAKQGRSETKH